MTTDENTAVYDPTAPIDAQLDAQLGDGLEGDSAPRTTSKGKRARDARAADREARKLEGEEATADAPRKRGRPSGSRKPEKLDARLNESLVAIAFLVGFFNADDGTVIQANAENLAKALDALAQENASVHRALVAMMTGSAWAGVAMAAFPIVAGVAANHKIGPFGGKEDGGSTDAPAPDSGPGDAATGGTPASNDWPPPGVGRGFAHEPIVVPNNATDVG